MKRKNIHNKRFCVASSGDNLNTQKWVSIHRLRRDGKLVEGFFAVGSMLNKAKRLRSPFLRLHITNDLNDAFNYASRHKKSWNVPKLKIESILLHGLELSGEVD